MKPEPVIPLPPQEPTADLASLRQQVADLEARVLKVERISGATVDTAGAMQHLQYKSAKRFWEAVRREQIPFSRLSARHCVFQVADLQAVLKQRQVGSGRKWRVAA